MVGYAFEAPAPPFPVFVLGYAINGFGMGLQARVYYSLSMCSLRTCQSQDAGSNGFVASLKENAAIKMGILHAIYGTHIPVVLQVTMYAH